MKCQSINVSCHGVDGSHNIVLSRLLCVLEMRSSKFIPVYRFSQPCLPLPSIWQVSINYSSSPFLTTCPTFDIRQPSCPTNRVCQAMIVCISCLQVLARSKTFSFDILSLLEFFIIWREPHSRTNRICTGIMPHTFRRIYCLLYSATPRCASGIDYPRATGNTCSAPRRVKALSHCTAHNLRVKTHGDVFVLRLHMRAVWMGLYSASVV